MPSRRDRALDGHSRTGQWTVIRWLDSMLARRGVRIAAAVALAGNVIFLAMSLAVRTSEVQSPLWDFWIANIATIIPALACFARAIVGGTRRAGAVWLGVAMLAFAVGNIVFVGWTRFQVDPPVPSVADLAYLAFYPCVAAAVFCLVRRDEGTSGRGVWLDGLLGAAGSATALAAVLSPILERDGGDLDAVVVGAAFTVADLLLIAMTCGVLAVRGRRGGSMWRWLAVGLALFCVADVVYALRVAAGTFVVGSVWSALWALGMTVAALALWRPERPPTTDAGRSTAVLAVPTVATGAAVVVLVVSSIGQLPLIVVALATLTLALAAVRILMVFRRVRRLSDAHRQSVTDELTGLGNRRALFEHGEQRDPDPDPADRIALTLIDLDNFKTVNDALGHDAGDELLREIARRLTADVRDPDVLVRLGGDEFAFVVKLAPGEDGEGIAEHIRGRISRPLDIEGARLRVDASAGVAVSSGSTATIPELLRRADLAMHAAKASGRRVEPYDARLDVENRTRLQTIQDLDAAISGDQFVLHYQPKMNVGAGTIIGAEALVRWEHPSRGLLHPDAFLPLVEQSGQMGAVTRLVLATAIKQIADWRAAGLAINVAVNLSASDLLDEHLDEQILVLLATHDVPVGALALEITESVLMIDPERAREALERLRGLGLRIAVDDFGTGYCALAYLRDLPIDELKIDRSFIATIVGDPRSAAIVRSTVELAHALDLEVVAEGVEEPDALKALATFGCDFAQGFHFSRPLTAAAFAAWAGDWSGPAQPRFLATLRP